MIKCVTYLWLVVKWMIQELKTIVERKNNTQYWKEVVHLINKTSFCQCVVHKMNWKQLVGIIQGSRNHGGKGGLNPQLSTGGATLPPLIYKEMCKFTHLFVIHA